MKLGIGIDTGGTYTDAVIYDFQQNLVLAKGKALTTKEELSIGIGQALDSMPEELLKKASLLALSTTLATNACVENKGHRAKLVLLGLPEKVLSWVDAKKTYGISPGEALCVEKAEDLNWQELFDKEEKWFSSAAALSVAAVGALQNGARLEKQAKEFLEKKLGVPTIMACQVAAELNAVERGATALLNARLLPVIQEFMEAVKKVMAQRELKIPAMIVRSDGSLMGGGLSLQRPVETILSGPAASVLGGRGLTKRKNCLIVDIGGTTTDISIVENNAPVMTGGIKIGGWRTQVKGVYIDTFGLGGDSQIVMKEGKLSLSSRRVEPMCVAALKWPELKPVWKKLCENVKLHTHQLYEALYLVKEPKNKSRYNPKEIELIERLKIAPCVLGSGGLDLYSLKSERLEDEGVVMRCGLTPTDIMHIKGDFNAHDTEAARLGARYLLNALPDYEDDEKGMASLCEKIYDMVCKKLYENIVRVLLVNKYKDIFEKNVEPQVLKLISRAWQDKENIGEMLDLSFISAYSLIGIGAPTHIFLEKVAKALKTECVIPCHAEVANAVGAAIADISVKIKIEITPLSEGDQAIGFTVYTENGAATVETIEEAIDIAKKAGQEQGEKEARERGAIGGLSFESKVEKRIAYSKEGAAVDLGTNVITSCTCGLLK